MRRFLFGLVILSNLAVSSQTTTLMPGMKAPDFIIHRDVGSIESFIFPYLKKMVYLHFWNNEVLTSRQKCTQLNHFIKRYRTAMYRNADGFEVVAIAVTNNAAEWKQIRKEDTLKRLLHYIALKGFEEEVCRKYNITSLPTGILIDENGMILAVDPTMIELESILDEHRNMQPARKDITGTMAFASNRKEGMKFCRIYLFNHYGDSLAKTVSSNTGKFTFSDIKINQDFILKVDNQSDIVTSDPATIYAVNGEKVLEGTTGEGGFIFHIPPALSNKLIVRDTSMHSEIQMDVVKSIRFTEDAKKLTPKDEQELALIIRNLLKSKSLKVEMTTHADTRTDGVQAMETTARQASTLRSYLEKKGIAADRISVIAKGNTEPRKKCYGNPQCTEEDHLFNRRVQIQIYKD